MYDKGDALVLTAEIPGARHEDLELTVVDNTLTLKGKRAEEPPKDSRHYRRERPMGEFTRTLALPEMVDPDGVTAEYRNGILTVQMSKAKAALPKKVKIA